LFDTKEIKQAFETFGKEVIQEARSNLTRKDKNVSKELYNGLNYEFEGYKGGFRFVINMPEYGMYQDAGVKGAETSTKAPDSPYKFGSGRGKKGGLTKGIDSWVRQRRIQFQNRDNGRFLSYDSTSFLIRRSVYLTGIKKTEWFTRAFELKYKRLTPKIEDALAISMEKLLDFTIKENFKK
jgi:hypothetical protein